MALPWLVLDAGGSASTAGLVAVFALVPYVLFGLFAGVTGDRRSRKRVIVTAHATQTACALVVPLWAITGATPEWLVLHLVPGRTIVSGLAISDAPARRTAIRRAPSGSGISETRRWAMSSPSCISTTSMPSRRSSSSGRTRGRAARARSGA